MRLDMMLFTKGICRSRENAKKIIEDSRVKVNGTVVTKASKNVEETDVIETVADKYVSRGALKLEKALDVFGIDVTDKQFMDCGASTGGFTDVLLQNGAKKVYAVDVGSSQLAEKLRNDERVVSIENTNIRYMEKTAWLDEIDGVVIDVSFISLKLILSRLFETVNDKAFFAALIKPQFEAGRDKLGKNGIVKDKKTHVSVLKNIIGFVRENGYNVLGLTYSPIKGGDGNAEYLIYFDKSEKIVYNINDRMLDELAETALSGKDAK